MADKRTYIRVHDGMPEHPKVEALSDKGFRLLMELWCWCSRNHTDGRIPAAVWAKRGIKKVRDELAEAGLVEVDGVNVSMHDYLEHQRSAEEIERMVDDKRFAGRRGNHARWHKNVIDPDCEFCPSPVEPDDPEPPDDPSQNRSHVRSQKDRNTDRRKSRKTSPEDRGQRTEAKEPTPVGMAAHDSNVRDERLPPGASGPTGVEAFRLVRRVLGLDYPAATCTALAFHAADLLKQFDEATVVEALAEWRSRTGIGPAVLTSIVADLVKRRSGHATGTRLAVVKPSTTDQRVVQAQALKALYANQPAIGTGA